VKIEDEKMDTSAFEKSAMDLFLPVMESATVLAGHYCKACSRTTITAQDMSYGLMYAARNVMGKQVGSLYPEIYDEEDTDEDEDEDEDDAEELWTRYSGDDDMACKMNECADTWSAWEPDSPAERALKNAVDKNSVFGSG
jgi:hypothetical protein